MFRTSSVICYLCFRAIFLLNLGGLAVVALGEHEQVRNLRLGSESEKSIIRELPVEEIEQEAF